MIIRPAKHIRGRLSMPGDKSISHRAAMMAALTKGTSRIKNFSTSQDCAATLKCLAQLGVSIGREQNEVRVEGVGMHGFRPAAEPLDCGNSGTTMRLLAGILASQIFTSVLTGDTSLRSRPMQRIIEPLQMMGAEIYAEDGRAPLTIQGQSSLAPIDYELLVASAQVKSCILLGGLNAVGRTQVIEKQPTRDHSERMLRSLGAPIETGDTEREGERFAAVTGPVHLDGPLDIEVPGDISSAAYFIAAAALLDGSSLEITNAGINPTRTRFLEQFRQMGLPVTVEQVGETNGEPVGIIRVAGSRGAPEEKEPLPSALIPQLIDELPLLAVVGSQVTGGVEIRNAEELRVKESDRIAAICGGLRAMGAEVEEFDDGLRVAGPTRLRGATIDPRDDHRIAMAFTVAALLAEDESEIKDSECVGVSFPEFFELMNSVVER